MQRKKYKKVVERHTWAKEEIKKLAKLWDSKNIEQLAKELDIEVGQVRYMAEAVRREYPKLLPKKHSRGVVRGLIREALG